jgi:hypothetical protein
MQNCWYAASESRVDGTANGSGSRADGIANGSGSRADGIANGSVPVCSADDIVDIANTSVQSSKSRRSRACGRRGKREGMGEERGGSDAESTGGASRVSISPSAAEEMIVAALEERATASRGADGWDAPAVALGGDGESEVSSEAIAKQEHLRKPTRTVEENDASLAYTLRNPAGECGRDKWYEWYIL